MNSKSTSIGILSITALILFIAQFIPVQPVGAQTVLKDRDFSLLSTRSSKGGQTIYVADNRTGLMAVFVWDAGRRSFIVGNVVSLADSIR